MSTVEIQADAETSRQRRQRETRRALLDAAYEAFTELGYADASLADIADRAGFTKGAIYASFASKEDLYLALVEQRMTEAVDVWAASTRSSLTGPEALEELVRWFGETVREKRAWHLVNAEFAVLAARRPEIAARRIETVRVLTRHFGDVLDRALPGVLAAADVEVAGRLLLAVMNGLILHAAADPAVDAEVDLATALRLLGAPTAPTTAPPATPTRQDLR